MERTIELVYQDAALLVCKKPAGVAVEGGRAPGLLTLLSQQLAGPVYPVHRLDLPVGGLLLAARQKTAAAALCRAADGGRTPASAGDNRNGAAVDAAADGGRNDTTPVPALQKRYLAVVEGAPQPADGQLRDLLYHDPRTNKTFVVRRPRRGVREAVLEYRTLAVLTADGRVLCPGDRDFFADGAADPGNGTAGPSGAERPAQTPAPPPALSLVEVRLLTGRTHQIRAQFAAHGHPLAGDGRYGSRRKGALALWSCGLAFVHPVSGAPLRFAAAPPDEGFWPPFAAVAARAAADFQADDDS